MDWALLLKRTKLSFQPLEAPKESYSPVQAQLLLTEDGKIGYAIFTVETSSHGRAPFRDVANAVAIDLTSMKVLSKGELGRHSYFHQVTALNELLSADTEIAQTAEYKVMAYGPDLIERASVRQQGIEGLKCWLRGDAAFFCVEDGRIIRKTNGTSNVVADFGSDWYVWHSPLSKSIGTWGVAFRDMVSPHREDRIWRISVDNQIVRSGSALTPECMNRWGVEAISNDGKELLAACFEEKEFMDAFFHTTLKYLELVDATSLAVRYRLAAGHGTPQIAVWHGNGQTIVATLDNAEKLSLYVIGD